MRTNKYILSLSTIPSRIFNIDKTLDSLLNQTITPEKIILNIPRKYTLRFKVSMDIINIEKLLDKYLDKIIINYVEEDNGPGTKLLGLLKSDINLDLKDTYIVLVDDDVIYKPIMLEYFNNYNKKKHNNNLQTASFFCYNMNDIVIGQAVDGFFIKPNLIKQFKKYYDSIKEYDFINFHDDYYISYYFHLKHIPINYIERPDNILIYDLQKTSDIDGLAQTDGKYNRTKISSEIKELVNKLNKEGVFDDIKNNK